MMSSTAWGYVHMIISWWLRLTSFVSHWRGGSGAGSNNRLPIIREPGTRPSPGLVLHLWGLTTTRLVPERVMINKSSQSHRQYVRSVGVAACSPCSISSCTRKPLHAGRGRHSLALPKTKRHHQPCKLVTNVTSYIGP